DQVAAFPADVLLGRMSEHAHDGAAHRPRGAVLIDEHHALEALLEDGAVVGLADSQAVGRLLAFRYVACVEDDTAHVDVVTQVGSQDLEPAPRPIDAVPETRCDRLGASRSRPP